MLLIRRSVIVVAVKDVGRVIISAPGGELLNFCDVTAMPCEQYSMVVLQKFQLFY